MHTNNKFVASVLAAIVFGTSIILLSMIALLIDCTIDLYLEDIQKYIVVYIYILYKSGTQWYYW